MKLKTSLGVEDNPDTSSLIDGKFRYDQFGYGVPAGHFLGMLRQKGFKTLVDEAIKYRNKEPQSGNSGGGSSGNGGGVGGSIKKPRQKRKQPMPMEAGSHGAAAPTTLDLSHHGAWEGGEARLADGPFTPPWPKRSAPQSIQGKNSHMGPRLSRVKEA
jgi:hypothetical protein